MQPGTIDLLPAGLPASIGPVLLRCLDVRAVWSIGHWDDEPAPHRYQLLAFADWATLQRLRKNDRPHGEAFELLVVVDGDRFENVWGGKGRLSGSLARLAWRPISSEIAYYDESRWASQHANTGGVVRVRRKAILLWRRQ